MTDDERDLLRCAALLRQFVTEAMEQLGAPGKDNVKDALKYLKDRQVTAVYPLEPFDDEDTEAAAHRIFGNYIYNQVFDRPPWRRK